MIQKFKNIYKKMRSLYPALDNLRANRLYFGNTVPIRTNLRYLRYHAECRAAYSSRDLDGLYNKVEEAARRFHQDGYVILHPKYDPVLLDAILEKCEQLVQAGKIKIGKEEDWFINFDNSMTHVPEIAQLVNEEVRAVAEACFGSHFKIYSSEIYRIIPTTKPPTLSGLWHTDNYPPGIYKIMAYLTRCDQRTGALGLHPRASTRQLLRAGFFDRYEAARFRDKLNRQGVHIEGPAGTILFWNSNLIHRANPPLTGHRDVVAFKLLPAKEPWNQHLARVQDRVNYEYRNQQVPANPLED